MKLQSDGPIAVPAVRDRGCMHLCKNVEKMDVRKDAAVATKRRNIKVFSHAHFQCVYSPLKTLHLQV